MAYKFSKGNRGLGDIAFEDDADTGIDFEADTIKLETGGSERVVIGNQDALVRFLNTTNVNKNALQSSGTATGVLEDASFSGLGSADFSVSCWFYANDTNTVGLSSNSRVIFYDGSSQRHMLDLRVPDIKIHQEDAGGSIAIEEYDTNMTEGNWYHVVAIFDVNSFGNESPKLFFNGAEVSGTGYSSLNGAASTIDKVKVYLDDGVAMQDLVFWNKHLVLEEVQQLYNSGNYLDPSTHSAVANIVSWFQLGYEPLFADAGFSAGDTLSGTMTIPDTIGTNEFTLTQENEFKLLARSVVESTLQSPALDIDSKSIRIREEGTPSSASDVGHKGEIRWDVNYLYICVATDTWKRIALSSW